MKRILLLTYCLLFFVPPFVQGQCVDYFDNDISLWNGDTSFFKVQGGYLHSEGPSKSSSLYLASKLCKFPENQWEIGFRLDFNPSSSNYLKIYLCASSEELEKAPSAYYIQLGEVGGKNQIKLYKKQADTAQLIFTGNSVFSNKQGVEGRIKVIYHTNKEWQIYYGEGIDGKFRTDGHRFYDPSFRINDFDYTGFVCKYTTVSRANMYHFDHFIISPYEKILDPPQWDELFIDDTALHLIFSKNMDSSSLCNPINHTLTCENTAILIPSISKIEWDAEFASQLSLYYDSEFADKTKYELTLNNIKDEEGNFLPSQARNFIISRPDKTDSADIIINEVMPHAADDCPEFIEIFQHAKDKEINLSHLLLGIKDKQQQWKYYEITKEDYILTPNSYTVLYKEPALWGEQKIHCGKENFFACHLPALSDEAAHIALFRKQDSLLIDEMIYHKNMHFPLLEETKGVSLERIEAKKSGLIAHNWHSAAESMSFASPGCSNSQSTDGGEMIDGYFSLYPEIISPNNDGIDDYLTISFSAELSSWCVSVWVYDPKGILRHKCLNQSLLGSQSEFRWNGLNDKNEALGRGMYILFVRFEKDGQKTIFSKKPLVIYR